MNYQLHYDRLMQKASNRTLAGYTEKHHVVPRCLGGDNSDANLVMLTAAEHYVAHQLLVKLHPLNQKIAFAAIAMSGTGVSPARLQAPNKLYEWLRKQYSRSLSLKMKGHHFNKGMKATPAMIAASSRPKSDQHKRNIGLANLGKTKGISRGPQSDAHKKNKGEARAIAWSKWREARRVAAS